MSVIFRILILTFVWKSMEFFFLRYFSPFHLPKVHGRTLHDVEQSLYYQNIKKLHPELVLSALPFRDLYGRLLHWKCMETLKN